MDVHLIADQPFPMCATEPDPFPHTDVINGWPLTRAPDQSDYYALSNRTLTNQLVHSLTSPPQPNNAAIISTNYIQLNVDTQLHKYGKHRPRIK